MRIVVILDQKKSRKNPDLVEAWVENLNQSFSDELTLPFTRTSGDEMQAVVQGHALGDIAQQAFISDSWWLGVGIGSIEEPLPKDTREGRGPAFWNAREAVEQAKGKRTSRPFVVSGGKAHPEQAQALEWCLGALAFIINRRTPSQTRASAAYRETHGSLREVAANLGISIQGARRTVNAAGCTEEQDLVTLTNQLCATVNKGASP